MNRRKFLGIAGGSVLVAGGVYYLLSDKQNFIRKDIKPYLSKKSPLRPVEREILWLASLTPSGHNTQPWVVKYIEPYHWIVGNDTSVSDLVETGRRMQRLFLKVRQKGIALHPMTQILEEAQTRQVINQSIGITDKIQFLLRTGYVNNYPGSVSLRRPVDWFVK
ncbi:hypothetical protein A4D02_13150 [Niastella koreensis]|uniref:Nitroreductase n=2 Tax=Niastella koreensis TaxID=354356 RepID=G8TMB8_NIAKG|nr:nitroreductase [Niastella koreensis]AEW00900.1 nitroreductase [Niastella koreensis GR20-10]OQP42509.1 hypothetical protein A4D02_13150 [Niastella koreensis]